MAQKRAKMAVLILNFNYKSKVELMKLKIDSKNRLAERIKTWNKGPPTG